MTLLEPKWQCVEAVTPGTGGCITPALLLFDVSITLPILLAWWFNREQSKPDSGGGK